MKVLLVRLDWVKTCVKNGVKTSVAGSCTVDPFEIYYGSFRSRVNL